MQYLKIDEFCLNEMEVRLLTHIETLTIQSQLWIEDQLHDVVFFSNVEVEFRAMTQNICELL